MASNQNSIMTQPLSDREKEVLRLVVEGLSNRKIGLRLGISRHTARNHVHNLSGKLGVNNRTGLVKVALEFKDQATSLPKSSEKLLTVLLSVLLSKDLGRPVSLSVGEAKVLMYMVQTGDLSDQGAANRFSLANGTVHNYVKLLFKKTRLHRRYMLLVHCRNAILRLAGYDAKNNQETSELVSPACKPLKTLADVLDGLHLEILDHKDRGHRFARIVEETGMEPSGVAWNLKLMRRRTGISKSRDLLRQYREDKARVAVRLMQLIAAVPARPKGSDAPLLSLAASAAGSSPAPGNQS